MCRGCRICRCCLGLIRVFGEFMIIGVVRKGVVKGFRVSGVVLLCCRSPVYPVF